MPRHGRLSVKARWTLISAGLASLGGALAAGTTPPYPFNDPALPTEDRISDLVARMTTAEKVGFLFMDANLALGNNVIIHGNNGDLPSTNISRLGVPMFDWMSGGNVYRGAPNGCNINCCSCYDGHNMSNCCVDHHATQFPQVTTLFCGRYSDGMCLSHAPRCLA
jgi:hypothetical protein